MKKSVFFIMILGAIAIAMGAQGQVTYTVTFSSNDLSFESVSASDGNAYSQVLLSGVTGNTTEAGKPKLPLRTLHLMIPFGKKVTSLEANGIATEVNCPQIVLSGIIGGRGKETIINEDNALGLEVSVAPNPASTWSAIDYQLPENASKASLVLRNSLGVIVLQDELYDKRGQKVVDLRRLANGVYMFSIESNGVTKNGKLIIAK